MLIFDNNNDVILIDNIYGPTVSDSVWVLDLDMMDFTLAPLAVLEEIICPTIEVMVWGHKFNLPANWNMLVADPETMQLDVAEIRELAGREFRALVYGPNERAFECAPVQVTDYFISKRNVGPSINKHQMLCHPISPRHWVNITPSDVYNKYLRNAVAGNLM